MARGRGQPAHVWTEERRERQRQTAIRALAKKASANPDVEHRPDLSLSEQLKRDPELRREYDIAARRRETEAVSRANAVAWNLCERLRAGDERVRALLTAAGIVDTVTMHDVMHRIHAAIFYTAEAMRDEQ